MKNLAMRSAFVAAALLVITAPASAQQTVRVLTSPSGSGPYNAFAAIQTHMEEFSQTLRLKVEETSGFNFNVKAMAVQPDRHKDTLFGSGSVLDWAAREGVAPFYPKPLSVAKDFRIVAVLGLSYNVWVTLDPSIRTPKDFVGRRVGIGLLTQNEWGMHQRMLLDGWNLTPKLRSLDTLGTTPNIDALLDGRTDVGTLFGVTSAGGKHTVVTGPHRQIEASNRDWKYVQVPAEMTEEYNKKTGAPFRVVHYAPNVLPNQPDPLVAFGDLLLLEAHKSFPDELAAELVRVMVQNYDKISQYNAFAKAWTPETLAYGASENPDAFHPGSLRAFRELGLIEAAVQ